MHGVVGRAGSALAEKPSAKAENVSAKAEAKRLVQLAAEPRQIGDSIKGQIQRASRALKWSSSRTKDVWYGDAKRITVAEMDALRALERAKLEVDFIAERRRNLEQVAVLRT